jgi:uroporphyrinogen-III decarboxylase
MEKAPEQLYQEREKRTNDAIQLKVPDRVPIMSLFGFFPAKYKGITFEEAMYDYDKMMKAWVDTMVEFQPDMYENPFTIRYLGQIMETLDFKQLKWPGHGCDVMTSYQYIEGEYMKADEYDAFLFDPSDFMVRTYWPRVFGAFDPFKNLPPIHSIITYYMGMGAFAAFDSPEIEDALKTLLKAAKEAKRLIGGAMEYAEKMKQLGFPPQFGGLSQAPFDTLSDFFRGTKGAMLDMFRHPDKILEACEKLLPIMLQIGLTAKSRGHRRVFIPLHKGLDGFMSPDQFNAFFWPTLRKLILGLIDEGLNPVLLWEGDCTSRLETIADIPKGKAIYWFERTDIFKAKEVLGDTVCIRGNIPLSIMCTGTPDDIKKYCKKLIDLVGKGGGFIMDGSTVMDDAKPENVKAMINFTKEYGVYS